MFHQTTQTTHKAEGEEETEEEPEAEAADNSENNKKKVWQIQCMHKPRAQRRLRERKTERDR